MKPPFWFQLVESWCQNRTGLTLPYVVGADARFRGTAPTAGDVSRILDEMCQHDVRGMYILVLRCPNLGAPVVSISEYGKLPFVIDESVANGKTQEQALRVLTEDAEFRVTRGEFSRVGDWPNYAWAELQPEDIEFIDGVIELRRRRLSR